MEDVFPTEIVPNLRGHVRFRGEVNRILMQKRSSTNKNNFLDVFGEQETTNYGEKSICDHYGNSTASCTNRVQMTPGKGGKAA